MKNPKVIYWNNMPTPYVVGRLNAVADRGNIDLLALFDHEKAQRSWDVSRAEWRFTGSYVNGVTFSGRGSGVHIAAPDLLVSLYNSPRYLAGSAAAKLAGSRTAFRVLPTFDSWVPRSRYRALTKAAAFRMVDSVKVSGRDGGAMAREYGVPDQRVFEVTQSIDIKHFGLAAKTDRAVREDGRRSAGLQGTVFLYVGRLMHKKGLSVLLDAFRQVVGRSSDASLLIVGDGLDEHEIRALAAGIPRVVFGGFVQPIELPRWYSLADVFVFPTLGDPHGLVVEEAMAAGLPVISSLAAGNIENRLPDGIAGYLVPPADADELAERMMRFVENGELRIVMGANAKRLVEGRDHERYAIDFERFVEGTLTLPRRVSLTPFIRKLAGSG